MDPIELEAGDCLVTSGPVAISVFTRGHGDSRRTIARVTPVEHPTEATKGGMEQLPLFPKGE